MTYKVSFEAKAEEEFAKLSKADQQKIFKYLKKLESREDPRTLGEALKSKLSSFWKYRVGNYRLIAEINDEGLIVIILVVAHRSKVYKIANKRLK